jgi:hypothetical protein
MNYILNFQKHKIFINTKKFRLDMFSLFNKYPDYQHYRQTGFSGEFVTDSCRNQAS